MSRVFICTPKCYAKNREAFEQHLISFPDDEFQPTADIYLNMLHDSWTEEKCDSILYIVDKEVVKSSRIELEFKDE
jgi:hypothetical protein